MKGLIALLNQALLDNCSDRLNISADFLIQTITQSKIYDAIAINQLLYISKRYHLDPLANEIILIEHSDAKAQAWITIDGWLNILHQQTKFSGLQFRESTTLIDGVPEWMECTIYRDDKILPFVIKEYFNEIQHEYANYQIMPKRMLRHKTLQQTIRLAFGISAPAYNSQTKASSPDDLPQNLALEIPANKTAQLKEFLNATRKE